MSVRWGATTGGLDGLGSVSPSWPAHVAGDLGFLIIETANEAVPATPSGWTQLSSSPQGTGTAGGTAATRLTVFYRFATSSSEAAPATGDSGNHQVARIFTMTGVDQASPIDVTAGGVKATASTAVSIPGVTNNFNDVEIIYLLTRPDDSNAAHYSGQANAALTGLTERFDAGGTAGNGGGYACWTGILATAGATGTLTATDSVSNVNAYICIALRPAGTPLNQVTSTETAQPFGRVKARTLGQATVADTGQPVTRSKARTVAQAASADTAQPFTRSKVRPVGQVAATETAQPITSGGGSFIPVNQVTSTDTAQPVTRSKSRAVGQAVSADTAQPMTRSKVRTVGQTISSSIANVITRVKARTVAQATVTETAQPVSRSKLRTVAQVNSAETAQPISSGGGSVVPVNQVTSAETAQPVGRSKIRTVGQAAAADTAQPFTRVKVRTLAQSVEAVAVNAFSRVRVRQVGQTTTIDTAQPVTGSKSRTVGQVTSVEAAQPFTTGLAARFVEGFGRLSAVFREGRSRRTTATTEGRGGASQGQEGRST